MKRHRRHIVIGVIALVAACPLAQAAVAGPADPSVPVEIKVPEGNKLFLVGHAFGVQIYKCNATGWGLVAPRADLYGDNGKLIATHFGGPTWQALDGSKVVGTRDGQVNVDSTAIPWLRLKAVPTGSVDDAGRLTGTTYIQRIATTGGLAPAASECNSTRLGDVVEVPYTADYYFWK